MATVRPFCAMRYNPEQVDYRVATFTQGEPYLLDRSCYHLKRLLEPEVVGKERSKFVKYARNNLMIEEWKKEEVLLVDKTPCFYLYEQRFLHPETEDWVTRTSLFCLLKLESYESGSVHPHEEFLPMQIEERLRLLESTYTHFEPIVGLYDDIEGRMQSIYARAVQEDLYQFKATDGVEHRVCKLLGADIKDFFEDKDIWIADGHHRYETALEFQASFAKRPYERATDYILACLVSMQDPGLLVYPLHHVLHISEEESWNYLSHLGLHSCSLEFLEQKLEKQEGFGLLFPTKGTYWIDDAFDFEKTLKGILSIENLYRPRDVLQEVEKGATAILRPFFTKQDLIESMKQKKQMPPKSTCFVPKPRSGLLLWSLSEETGFYAPSDMTTFTNALGSKSGTSTTK